MTFAAFLLSACDGWLQRRAEGWPVRYRVTPRCAPHRFRRALLRQIIVQLKHEKSPPSDHVI